MGHSRMSSPALHPQDWVLVEGVGSPVTAACHLVSGSGGGRGAPGEEDGRESEVAARVPGGGVGRHWLPQPQGEGSLGGGRWARKGPSGVGVGGPRPYSVSACLL